MVTEELKLDLILVVSYPGSIFKFHLFYRDGNATGMVGVYGFNEEWYYLYKGDTEKYKVKRRKDLECKKPDAIYEKHEKAYEGRQDKPNQTPDQGGSPSDSSEHNPGMQMG